MKRPKHHRVNQTDGALLKKNRGICFNLSGIIILIIAIILVVVALRRVFKRNNIVKVTSALVENMLQLSRNQVL